MQYAGMPMGMWLLFSGSFKEKLTSVLGFSNEEAAKITAAAKPRYKAIIADLPEFEKQDRFQDEHSQLRYDSGVHTEYARAPVGG